MDHDQWLRFILASLAVWRLTHFFAAEDGPWDAVARLRNCLGDSMAGRAMDCFYCLSLWIAAPIAAAVTPALHEFPLLWLALSGAACLLEQLGNPSLTRHDNKNQET